MGKYTEVAQRHDGSHDSRLDGDRRQVIRAWQAWIRRVSVLLDICVESAVQQQCRQWLWVQSWAQGDPMLGLP